MTWACSSALGNSVIACACVQAKLRWFRSHRGVASSFRDLTGIMLRFVAGAGQKFNSHFSPGAAPQVGQLAANDNLIRSPDSSQRRCNSFQGCEIIGGHVSNAFDLAPLEGSLLPGFAARASLPSWGQFAPA